MAQFDPVLKEHIAKVQGGASHTSYLGNIIQENEFIDCISKRVVECMTHGGESRINSVEVVRFQAAKVRDALLEVRGSTADPAIKIEAQALAEEVGSYRFSICTVVWYDILKKVQTVNKLLQSQCMQLDVAVDILKKAETSLVSYRDTGFADAQTSAKEIFEEMNAEAALKQKRL
ncbi:uncharacterized protein LOC135220370 [Macrobrachium nipponense]|uniref:uncharacterized protein LOC135220370 n=1 Tax=Macrobrachium nipponense TaxID=159736 RepID=UPI0030C8A70A